MDGGPPRSITAPVIVGAAVCLLAVACSGQELDESSIVVACVSSRDEVDPLMEAAVERFDETEQRVGALQVARSAPGVLAVIAPGSSDAETADLTELMANLPNVVKVVRHVGDC